MKVRKLLLFGMPGTGKSTAAKELSETFLELDLGSEQLSEKQLLKIRSMTEQLLRNDVPIISSYPLYFNDSALSVINDILIICAIPRSKEAQELVLARVESREGKNSEFLQLYTKNMEKWVTDWSNKMKRLPAKKVMLIEYYEPEVKKFLKTVYQTGEYTDWVVQPDKGKDYEKEDNKPKQ